MKPAPKTDRPHLNTPIELLNFAQRGVAVTFVSTLALFWNSPHSSAEIAVAIAVPLIIFNCMPIFLLGFWDFVSRLQSKSDQTSLLFENHRTRAKAKPLPLKYRLIAYGIIGLVVSFFAGVAIFLASFTYSSLSIPWAVQPARQLSFLLLRVSTLPIVVALSFFAGIYYQAKFRNSEILRWLLVKVRQPFTYWPTTI